MKSFDTKKKKSVFWKMYLIVVAALCAFFLVIWIVLWNFLSAYEKSRPEHAMEKVIEQFQNTDTDSLIKEVSYTISEFETEDIIKQALADNLTAGEWTFSKKTGKFSKDAPVYQVKKDGKNAAVVYFDLEEKRGAFNTPRWSVNRIEGIIEEPKDYTINVPEGSKVTVNGIELDSSYITQENVECKNLGNVAKYIEAPVMTSYTVSGLYAKPQVEATGPVYQTALNIDSEEDGVIDFAFEGSAELAAVPEETIIEITKIYGNYITNDTGFSAISPYILPGSYAYEYLRKIVYTNIWFAEHSGTDFQNMKVYNYQNFTESSFACEVSFDHVIQFNGENRTTPTHIRYIFIKQNGRWYVADMSLKE